MNVYAIEFKFPEVSVSVYASDYKGAAGLTPHLGTARLFADEAHALTFLKNAYGETNGQYGRVIEVPA